MADIYFQHKPQRDIDLYGCPRYQSGIRWSDCVDRIITERDNLAELLVASVMELSAIEQKEIGPSLELVICGDFNMPEINTIETIIGNYSKSRGIKTPVVIR
jgi:hypothetical protein